MSTPPDDSEPAASRGWILPAVILLLIAVGVGMYSLGRRSQVPLPAGGSSTMQSSTAVGSAEPVVTGRHFAPRDTFFLLDYVSAKTASGVIGFEPGRKVHLVEVRPAAQTLVVGDEEAQVEVGPEKLTNDLDIAALARQKDEANQAKIAVYLQQEKAAYDKAQREGADKFAKALDKIYEKHQEAAKVAASTPPTKSDNAPVGSGSKLDEPPVSVGGTSGGYGYAGSGYYGSPYSYFSGSTSTVAAPAAPAAQNPATVGAGRR